MLWNSYCVHRFSFILPAWPSFRICLFTEEFWVIATGADFSLKRSSSFSPLWWEGGAHPRPEDQCGFHGCVWPRPRVRDKIFLLFHPHSLLLRWPTLLGKGCHCHIHAVMASESAAADRALSMTVTCFLIYPTQDMTPAFLSSKSHCTGWKMWMTVGKPQSLFMSVLSHWWHHSLN